MADTTLSADVEHEAHSHDDHQNGGHGGHTTSTGLSNGKVMMWGFLGSECLLFGALISTYILYKERHKDWVVANDIDRDSALALGPRELEGAGGEVIYAHGVFDIPFTSASSFILLVSSLTMVLALSAIRRADYRNFKIWTLTTAAMGSVFIAGQVFEFTEFHGEGLGFTTNIFGSAFYTLTGFHGVHVSIGIVMLLTLLMMHSQGRLNADKSEAVEIVGLYWHFVDIVWILIFTVVYLFPQ